MVPTALLGTTTEHRIQLQINKEELNCEYQSRQDKAWWQLLELKLVPESLLEGAGAAHARHAILNVQK